MFAAPVSRAGGQRGVRIGGWGKYIPERILTNADLERMVETSDEWIVTRTGIRQRHIAADHEGTTSMMLAAAREALQRAEVDGTQVQLIIAATVSPDFQFPAVACLLQAALGARAGAFDVQAGCSGFVYALVTAVQFIHAGVYDRALVAGGDTLSRLVDWTDRDTCILFGDGAGAIYLEATDGPGDFRGVELGADGTYPAALYMDGVARARCVDPEAGPNDGMAALRSPARHITMDGRHVFRFATRALSEAVAGVSAAAGWRLEQIDLVIPHQANQRIIEAASKTLGVPLERFYTNVERYGNMSDASVPVALCEAIEAGRLHRGDRLVLAAFGAGLTWAAAAINWSSGSRLRAALNAGEEPRVDSRSTTPGAHENERPARDAVATSSHEVAKMRSTGTSALNTRIGARYRVCSRATVDGCEPDTVWWLEPLEGGR